MEILRKREMMYFDLETEGLEPMEHALRCVGMLDPRSGEITIKTASSRNGERDLLAYSIGTFMETAYLGGWNITEFDLMFLAVRAHYHDLVLPIKPVEDEPFIGKYGNPRVVIPARAIHDMAYDYRRYAEEMDVRWSLQGMAQAIGWEPNTDLQGEDMPNASLSDVAAHCADDLSAMHKLVNRFGFPAP